MKPNLSPVFIPLILLTQMSMASSEVLEGPNHGHKITISTAKASKLLKEVKAGSAKVVLEKKKTSAFFAGKKKAINSKEKILQCDNDELTYLEIERDALDPFFSSLSDPKDETYWYITKEFKSNFKFEKQNQGKNLNPGRYYSIDRTKNFVKNTQGFKDYLATFKNLNWTEIKGLRVLSSKEQRDSSLSMLGATIALRADVRGIDKSGNLRNDKLNFNISVEKQDGQWKVSRVDFLKGEMIIADSSKPYFANLTASVLKDNPVKIYRRSEAIRRGGYALSLGDYNKDGNFDMYVGQVGNAQMFTYQNEKLTEVKPKGLEFEGLAKSSSFVDLNQDGFEDLMVVRFIPPEDQRRATEKPVVLYKNNKDGSFSKIPYKKIAGGLAKQQYAMPSAIGDFNNDGLNDLYVGYPGVRDFTHLVANQYNSKVQGLYTNQGDFNFKDDTKRLKSEGQREDHLYPHSSIALDYDRDGDLDLVVIDDRNNLSPIYENDGKGNFRQANKITGFDNGGYAMSLAAGDLNSDGITDLIVSNVESGASQRMGKSCSANWGRRHRAYREEPLNVYFGTKEGFFTRVNVEQLGLNDVGEGLAGVQILDFNNDGLKDIYVANGLWTGTDPRQDLGSYFAIMQSRQGHNISSVYKYDRDRYHNQSLFMDLLSFFKGDIYSEKAGNTRPSLSGFQKNRLYQNLGNGKFVDVAHMAGLDSLADGYMVATHDINKDGKQDLILRNGDPGSVDVPFPSVEIFRNEHPGKNNSLALKLEAVKSNTDAIGTLVEVHVGKNRIIDQVVGLHGTVQSSRELSFGLGKSKKADRVIIKWPSGKDTILTNLKAGRHVIRENQKINKSRISKN